MATVAMAMPSPIKPVPMPIAPFSTPYTGISSTNSSRKRSHAESVGASSRNGYASIAGTSEDSTYAEPTSSNVIDGNHNSAGPVPPHTEAKAHIPGSEFYIGTSSDFEPLLLNGSSLERENAVQLATTKFRKIDQKGTYARISADFDTTSSNRKAAEDIDRLVRPNQESLMRLYFDRVNSVLPILDEDETLRLFSARTLDPCLVASVYLISRRWLGGDTCGAQELEDIAVRTFESSLSKPRVSTVQAGLLLIQSSTNTSNLMSTQLMSIGYDLGLHQDCSEWDITQLEKRLRKRLGWMLYAQDKWLSLLHGRPSYVSGANWTVAALCQEDFGDVIASPVDLQDSSITTIDSAGLVMRLTALTQILSEILERFYTLGAEAEVKAAGNLGLRVVLEKAKPVQIKLKDWFSRLPENLKMDTAGDNKSLANGSLHLAYFAAEITLHRCIIRATAQPGTDAHLSYICRSAAKTRLISAMDFVNRLRPVHLRSFWPFAGFANFALIGTFGALLEATAPTREEAEFYHMRLEEYHWTLTVSRNDADFLEYAIKSLDTSLGLLQHLPEKPSSTELGRNVPMSDAISSQQMSSQNQVELNHGSASTYSGLVSPATSSSSDGQELYLQSDQQ